MWLVVTVDSIEKDVCPGHPENEPGRVHFEILSHKTGYGPVMRFFGHIGSMMVNAQRDNAACKANALSRSSTQSRRCRARRMDAGKEA
jgi:hypothetical protein